ncbi:MAG: ABC transporter permease [Acutalibacteraceae bacterium]|jgi:spermidine/putrescine transport system permease protein
MKVLSRIYNGLIFLFLYAPIVLLIAFSFNNGKSRVSWKGFTLRWYESLFHDELILKSLKITLLVAVIAMVVATVIGTAAAVGMHGMNKRLRRVFMTVNNLPMVNPEIVTGVSLMLMYVFIFRMTGLLKPGFFTLALSHVTFCLPYVVLQVAPKLRQMNPHMYEAAVDLGCHPVPAFFKVVLPEIMPGVLTGALMAFTLSLDDFVISYFNSGSSAQTLSVTIYSMTKKPITPEINALSTLLFGSVLVLLVLVNIYQIRDKADPR